MDNILNYYKATFKMRSLDPTSRRYVDIWSFTSDKSHKRYVVEVEYFTNEFYGIKFYWKGVVASKNRYSLLTNDYEPRTIVMSCVKILEQYYRNNRLASFGFVAAPDLITSADVRMSVENKRFRFYRRFMLSVFGPNTFLQAYDEKNLVYLLINRRCWEEGRITLGMLEKEIERLYDGDFNIVTL